MFFFPFGTSDWWFLAVKRHMCDKESWAKVTELFHDIFLIHDHSTVELWFIVNVRHVVIEMFFFCFS